MRPYRVPVALLLLVSTSLVMQTTNAEDIYWEGEEDTSNEFLEVKEADLGISGHLKRLKRDFFDFSLFPFISSSTTTTEAPEPVIATDDPNVDDEELDHGSGQPDRHEPELREKTLRVTFVVMEPYQEEYNKRESEQFQSFSKAIADSVNLLYENLPGTQRASLVRIQSRVIDELSCKVTLDIVTSGYEDTDRITQVLQDHIRNSRKLGQVVVSDADFSAKVIDPGVVVECSSSEIRCNDGSCVPSTAICDGTADCSDGADEIGCSNGAVECSSNEIRCSDGSCVSGTALCDGNADCADGADEVGCIDDRRNDTYVEQKNSESPSNCVKNMPCRNSVVMICAEERCDGFENCPEGDDEDGCNYEQENEIFPDRNEIEDDTTSRTPSPTRPTTSPPPPPPSSEPFTCSPGDFACDDTRCVSSKLRCDGVSDCNDGADEAGCDPENCGVDDFRCSNGKCIKASSRCDRIVNCPSGEDEQNCDCVEGEFRCVSDGSCIQDSKRCNGINNCLDGSDEANCACSTGQWQCDFGSCIKRSKRCDGRVDCPSDRSDERNCYATGKFRCRTGKLIPEHLRCNRRYDCPINQGDYSDEQNCPCGEDDFQCDNGNCIPVSKHCDRTHDCQDSTDERDCIYGTVCMAFQYKCSSGQCVPADSFCNGTKECQDGSDERKCPCKRGQFQCRDGSCINIALRCNGHRDCRPNGEDEVNCGYCPGGFWQCEDGSCISQSRRCDGRSDCLDRSDEKKCATPKPLRKAAPSGCPADSFTCDAGSRVQCAQHCDGNRECDGGEDEDQCNECSHECDGLCLDDANICNGYPDCSDGSDELNCDQCDGRDDFRCNDGECINAAQYCNGIPECPDESDELYCNKTMITKSEGCADNEFRCRDGTCINRDFFCDNNRDCNDNSDEENCAWYLARPSRSPGHHAPCHESEFTCYDGNCITHLRRCDNIYDCKDFSDEQNCYNSGCSEDQWSCPDGLCIPLISYCDGLPDCSDSADEADCPALPTTTSRLNQVPVTTPTPTTQGPRNNNWDSGRGSDGYSQFDSRRQDGCLPNEWRCENGPCIDARKRCDGTVDCLFDTTDELDCPPSSPLALNLKTYPPEQTVRNGGDVVFQCRDEGPQRAPVRWVRAGGRPIKPGFTDINGRLEINKVTPSDSGVYICQAVNYLGQPGSELQVTLVVEPGSATIRPAFLTCQPNEATCGNGQCISKSAVCNGVLDCADGSDEDTCFQNGKCEPNNFKCDNNKCILKTWYCDSEDDCGDGSDERDCGSNAPGQPCRPSEFACTSGDQCVPKSFHCDNQQDCMDNSDELGCLPVYVTRPAQPSNVQLNVGDTLILNCSATGVPKPMISWRRNWGNVPDVCVMENFDSNGQTVGVLTCRDMQPEYNGAYSCEAMNNKGTTLAVPDAIVIVNKTNVCPNGYFNSQARSAQECIRCFCFGESTQCHSADLFTFNMPTPLGEGGTRLVGVSDPQTGQIDSQPITDEFYYQALKNGATVTKLARYRPNWGWSNSLPYLTLPYTYNGKQLTSYGGHIRYRLSPHSSIRQDNTAPDIIIKGKHQNLMHFSHAGGSIIEARLTPENWQKSSPTGLVQATREDIMMALDDIEMILLRASIRNAGVNITDFVMESAQHVSANLGVASLVEECTCPTGYEGLSCEKCASGYARETSGAWLGNCVLERPECPQGTYGDPRSGYACRPCPCPLTNSMNQFATSCAVNPAGDVVCRCAKGYQGTHCESCAPGYVGNPLVIGDSCREKPTDRCNAVGTLLRRLPDECDCKDNVQGPYCDQCKDGSFYLSDDFRHGCALCFCSGVSQQCSSSTLRRKTNLIRFNTPDIVNQVRVYDNTPPSGGQNARYNAPTETNLTATLERGEVTVSNYDRLKPTIYYWSLPVSFAGDKVTSYGGILRYILRLAPVPGGYSANNAADVQIISENHLTFHYSTNFSPSPDGTLDASVQLLEKGWQRQDGKEVSRQHFLLALADVKAILVKATYTSNYQLASLVSASIETAEDTGTGPPALHVEQCVCPKGYVGTSCEDCAPGYTRIGSGLYLEHCGPCECNDHSSMCDTESGVCYNCQHNTEGDNCERCKPGYRRDNDNNCVPERAPPLTLTCDPRGTEMLYSSNTYCQCKQNVEGQNCDTCRTGTFSLDSTNPLGCYDCYCSGVTNDCHESNQFIRVPLAAPMLGDNYGGYTLMNVNGDRVLNPNIVSMPTASELMFVFNFPPNEELYWSLPVFPGNRVKSYGGSLRLKQKFESRYASVSEPGTDVILIGETQAVFWTNPQAINVGEPLSYQVPLSEKGWSILNSATPASRSDLMAVLRNLQRVLVRATLTRNIESSSIADVSMDTATDLNDPNFPKAIGVEVCMCPNGYTGTSCESCVPGFYQEGSRCQQCPCNGHGCHQDGGRRVVCDCRPPYTGSDCSLRGLIMELHPTILADTPNPMYRRVALICKYKAPEPLNIKFFEEGREVPPHKPYKESMFEKDGWHGHHVLRTVWDIRRRPVFECHTVTQRGFTLGVLSTSLPEPGQPGYERPNITTTLPPPPRVTVDVRITSETLKIQKVGSSVNFTCQAQSLMSRGRLPVNWFKEGGYLPQDRAVVDASRGMLIITNLQISDSGKYICQASDGVSTIQDYATLRVPGNPMTPPTVEIRPPGVKEYYEGDRVELECIANGNPSPQFSWQRAVGRALPVSAQVIDNTFIIESVRQEDGGEYRCIATNQLGISDGTAIVSVRPRPASEPRDKLLVSQTSPNVNEGHSTRIVCTGSTNVPAGTIDWTRQDGTEFLANMRSVNGVLYIDTARLENQGVYICQTSSYDVQPVLVVVTIIPQGTPAPELRSNITVPVKSLRIPQGGTGTVQCEPTGYPRPQIRWSKSQDQFGPGTSQRNNELIISNAREEDQGYYACEGSVDGKPIATIYVFVEIERREQPKIEIWPQGEQAVTLESPFELRCRVVAGIPEPDVTWSRNGGRTLSSLTQILPNNVLRFEKVDVNDEGEYSCFATNIAGTASASAVIKVRSPPEVIITPSEYIEAVQGDPITVECRANGYPQPMVSIRSQLRELVAPAPGIAVLRISSASDRDDGDYICSASSLAGNIEEPFGIRVDRGDGGYGYGGEGSGDIDVDQGYPGGYPDQPGYPGDQRPKEQYANEGQTTRLGCSAPAEYEVRWSRADRRPLQSNAQQSGYELIIRDASKADSGDYVCDLTDRFTGELQRSIQTRLRVMTPPQITLEPITQTVQPGESPHIECIVKGDDIEETNWRSITRPMSRRVVVRGTTLIFNRIEVEDAGKYECFARNRLGNATGSAEVIVSEETGTESHDNEQRAHVGAAVQLRCDVHQPVAEYRISWTKNGAPLPRSVLQRRDGSLHIRLAQKSDSGYYVCDIQDKYGRRTSNYINLHIDGDEECSDTQFRCYDNSGCVDIDLLCDGFNDCPDESDEGNCILREKRVRNEDSRSNYRSDEDGPPESLVSIAQPRRIYRIGENVEVLCRIRSRDYRVTWERYGTNQFVDSKVFGDGAMLSVPSVQESDAGLYRCTGTDGFGRSSYEDFNLEVQPGSNPVYPDSEPSKLVAYSARLGDIIDMPCIHNLETPVSTEWRREYASLRPDVRPYETNLHLDRITESDAGIYVCRVSNSRTAVEIRAVLKVQGVVPQFDGNGWIALPTLKDAYKQFDIEISFKPRDANGLILYNSQNQNREGDYLALQLVDGIPHFVFDSDNEPYEVKGDRPLMLNTWHTIRISKTSNKLTMDVDNNGPTSVMSSNWELLELAQPMYIGGVRDYDQLPSPLAGASGFIGCVSMVVLGREEFNIMVDSIDQSNVLKCDSCSPNLCYENGVCQEARNERGYVCICAPGYTGLNCDRTGEACRPDLCGPGKCADTPTGYKCICPVTYTGNNCEHKQNIEYPAFTGSAYLAIKAPKVSRIFRMSMKVKAAAPVSDGIIMYCAEYARGYGGFTSLTVHDGRLQFTYDLGDGSQPVVLTNNKTLSANEWTDVDITRMGPRVTLKINKVTFEGKLVSGHDLALETPMFVGGVDDSIVLNKNTGVSGGFSGCIKDVTVNDVSDIVGSSIQSANVQECSNYDRGDIPEMESACSAGQCRNGGECPADGSGCECPSGFTGQYCEVRVPLTSRRPASDACAAEPCQNGGRCRRDYSTRMNYTCDCPLGFAGANCQMPLELLQSVSFAGNGYIELPGSMLTYENITQAPVIVAMAFYTENDGVLLYQREALAQPGRGDFLLIRVEGGRAVVNWDLGGGVSTVIVDSVYVADGDRHSIILKLFYENYMLVTVDDTTVQGETKGFSNIMNADSNVYVGGIPDGLNVNRYPGLNGCVAQVELMNMRYGINLGRTAVTGRNTQRCRNFMFPELYPYFEDPDIFEYPPQNYFNSYPIPLPNPGLLLALPPFLCVVHYF